METLLSTIRIRGFVPLTFRTSTTSKQKAERKKKTIDRLRDEILKHHSLEEVRDKCRGKRISMRVRFYLWNGSNQTTRAEKDLDNLLKILLDSLCEYNEDNNAVPDLGIIKNDDSVFEIHADKKLVSNGPMKALR